MKNPEVKIVVTVEYKISLWMAIKLRIAGKAYQFVAEEIMRRLRDENEGKA